MSTRLLDNWNAVVARDRAALALVDDVSHRTWTRAEIDAEADHWRADFGEGLAGATVAFSEVNGADWMRIFLGLLKADARIAALDPGEPTGARRATAESIKANFLWQDGRLDRIGASRPRPRDERRLVKLTSGSTGAPRPLWFTDEQLLADGRHIVAGMAIAAHDVNLGIIPWGHSYGLGNLVLPFLIQGTAIVSGVAPLPHAIASAVARARPTVFPAVPALLRALAEAEIDPALLDGLRTVISAGAPLTSDVAQAFSRKFGIKIHSFYGSSETGGICYDPSGDSASEGRGVGRPLPGVKIELGRGGRFLVSSDAVFTAGNRRKGQHRMPDFGRIADDGEVVLLGRAGRFVKIAGRRLNLAEVESVVRQLPGVRDAFVQPHSERPDALAVAVASPRAATELRDALRERLASWKIPRKWLVLPEFPLTPRGKTDTRLLRERLSEGV
jgi:acyl-coenzyme A synthetase/AMP-(fatty) acid ligase